MLQTLKDWDLYAQRQVQFLQIGDIAKVLQQAQQKENPYNLNAIKKINVSDTAEFSKINNTVKSHYLILKT